MKIEGIKVTADFKMSREEAQKYVDYVETRIDDVDSIHVHLCDDDMVDITWVKRGQKFERIRRITGYLVGTIDRWNDAKQAEEQDRVKHDGISEKGNIYEVVSRYVDLKQEGIKWRGKCPFCGGEDSFLVRPDVGFFLCESCKKCGNAPKFLSLVEKITYSEACERMKHE